MANANININISSKGAEKSLNTLQADIEATREELDRLIKSYGENSKEADKMRKNLVGLEVEMNKLGGATEMLEQSTQSLKSQLRQMTNELAGLEPGSARFQQLSVEAGKLRDRIKDTNAVINATAGSGVENFGKALGAATQLGMAGFQGLIGIQALFGTENKDLQEQLVKLTAVLNLTQAISAFGAIGDTFTQIKSGIVPLITSMYSFVAAETAAAGATGGLAVALNALPFVAIATAVGLLVYALYDYISASDEAAEKEKKRQKELERLKKIDEERTKVIKQNSQEFAKEVSGFIKMTAAVKAAEPGSKERIRLVNELNTTYGTTLKNLSDEKQFIEQVNISIADYIAFQRARFREAKASQAIEGEFAKQEEAIAKARKIAREGGLNDTQINNLAKQLRAIQAGTQGALEYSGGLLKLSQLNQMNIENQAAAIRSSGRSIEQYTTTIKSLQKEINSESNALYNNALANQNNKKSVDDSKDSAEDYGSILGDLQKIIDETTKLEEQNYITRQELSKKAVDTKELERKKIEVEINKVYEAFRLEVEKEVKDTNKKVELLKAAETALFNFRQQINEQTILEEQKTQQQRIDNSVELNKYLLLEEKALQNEIRFGDGDTTDTLISNQNRRLDSYLKSLETQQLRSQLDNKLSVKQFTELQKEKERVLKEYYTQEDQSIREAAEAEYKRLVDLETKKYDLNKEFVIKKTEFTNALGLKDYQIQVDFADKNIELRQKEIPKLIEIEQKKIKLSVDANDTIGIANNKLAIDKISALQKELEANKVVIDNRQKLEENLRTTNTNLNEQYLTKLNEQNTNFFTKLKELEVKTQDDIFKKKIETLENFLQTAQQMFSQFNDLVQQSQELRFQAQETALDDYVNYETSVLDQQLANRLMTEEEYNARLKQIELKREQDLLQLKRKQFQQDKAMNIAEATIDAARATLSTFANTPGELIIKSIAAGIAAAFGAAQIALIAKQEFKAAVGGIVPQNGLSGNRDSVSATLAPGEAVINSNSTNAFLPILDFINRMGGGKSLMPEMPGDNGLNRFQPVYQQGSNQPVRAYVVSSDIENNMSRMNRIRRSTRF